MRMEIDRNRQMLFEQTDQTGDTFRRNQTAHILDGNHIGSPSRHLLGFGEEILIGEHRLGQFLSFERSLDAFHGRKVWIDRIAHGTIGNAAILFHVLDGRLHVVHVVQRIEDPHDAQPRLNRITTEPVDNLIGIGCISEKVATPRECRQFRNVTHSRFYLFETIPRVFVQIPHHRIGNGTTPHLHRIKIRILVER